MGDNAQCGRCRVLQVHQGLGRDGVIAGSSRVAASLTQGLGSSLSYDADLCLLGLEDPCWPTYGLSRRPFALGQSTGYRNPLGQLRSILRLRKRIRDYAPGIVHSHTWPVAMIAGFALAGLPVRHVVHIHDMRPWLLSPRLQQKLRRSIHRWAFHLSHATFIACAGAVRDHALLHLLSGNSRVDVLLSGVDVSFFAADPADSGPSTASAPVVLGMAGTFQPMKGHEILLRAMAEVRARGLDLRLRLAGWGALEGAYKQTAEDLGLAPFVTFMGRVRDMRDFYRQIDIYVLPSLSEGLPLSILEAMAAGRPVISTRVGGVADAIRDGKEGLLVPPGNAPDLATAIERLVREPGLRREMGMHGRARVERDFRVERMVEQVEQYYTTITGTP